VCEAPASLHVSRYALAAHLMPHQVGCIQMRGLADASNREDRSKGGKLP
jgi:hypothetical protein